MGGRPGSVLAQARAARGRAVEITREHRPRDDQAAHGELGHACRSCLNGQGTTFPSREPFSG